MLHTHIPRACLMTVFTWCGVLPPAKLPRKSWSASAGSVLATSCFCAATRASMASLYCPCLKRVRAADVSVWTSTDSFCEALPAAGASPPTDGRRNEAATAATTTSTAMTALLPQWR